MYLKQNSSSFQVLSRFPSESYSYAMLFSTRYAPNNSPFFSSSSLWQAVNIAAIAISKIIRRTFISIYFIRESNPIEWQG